MCLMLVMAKQCAAELCCIKGFDRDCKVDTSMQPFRICRTGLHRMDKGGLQQEAGIAHVPHEPLQPGS